MDLYKFLSFVSHKVTKNPMNKFLYLFNDFGLNKVDALHFWNTIPTTNKKFFITFETYIPFPIDVSEKKAFKKLASSNCKKLIAISQRAYDAQLFKLEKCDPILKQKILSKTIILHPPQEVISTTKDYYSSELICTFIGSAFFRKGGYEILKAFEEIKDLQIKINIISSLESTGFLNNPEKIILEECRKIIESNKNISHYKGLPNSQALELLKNSHIGILPTWMETYGYSILESMATGCAIVTTNTPPMNEFVVDNGWLIDMDMTYANGTYRAIKNEANHKKLVSGIVASLKEAYYNRDLLKQKGQASIKRIQKYHCPKNHELSLQSIWSEM